MAPDLAEFFTGTVPGTGARYGNNLLDLPGAVCQDDDPVCKEYCFVDAVGDKEDRLLRLLPDRTSATEKYLNLVGLKGFEHRYPYELSGGMSRIARIPR